ncbi:MAG: isochorismatase family protein [Deltaproteobacteria bacterium]|nr:isochorismatase family protein [Deltaproteobacteria bacterium]
MAERVWDRFLTEQDRAHVAMKPPRRIGFGQRPALLLIDLYRWVFGNKPEPILEATKNWPGSCGTAGWNSLPYIQKLLGTAREIGIPIIHITGLPEDEVEPWSFRGEKPNMSPEARERRKGRFEIVDEVKPLPGEAVLRKASPSAFWGTPLAGHLNYLDVDTVITCGESTSGCVRASVVEGATYRLRMIVVEECVFDRHEACHAINLFDMNQKYADVLPLAEVLQYLHQWGEKNRARATGGDGEGGRRLVVDAPPFKAYR